MNAILRQIPWLDPILDSAKPGQTIVLDQPTYYTRGYDETGGPKPGSSLNKDVNLIGNGRTRIVMKNDKPLSATVLYGKGNNRVEGITVDTGVDLSTTTQWPWKRNGVWLEAATGSRNVVSKVQVINPFGNTAADREAFGIWANGENALVEGCSVFCSAGDYVVGIGVCTGAIRDCLMVFPPPAAPRPLAWPRRWVGMGTAQCKSLVVTGCRVINADDGFYYDTGDIDGLSLVDNEFYNCRFGVVLKNQYQPGVRQVAQNIEILRNRFEMPVEAEHVSAIGINNTRLDNKQIEHDSGCIQNIVIGSNCFTLAASQSKPKFPKWYKRAIGLASTCKTPVLNVAGILNVRIYGNCHEEQGPEGDRWTYRNMWSAAQGIMCDDKIEWGYF